jgi:hypothetical protein
MNTKLLKGNEIRFAQVATGLSPADFPLGSLESRAIARAVLDHAESMTPRLSQYDEDALTIYRSSRLFLHGNMSPDLDKLKLTASYQRGEKLEEARGLSEDQEVGDRAQGVVRMEEIINNCLERAGNEPLEFPTDCAPAFRQKIVLSVAQKMLFGELDQACRKTTPSAPIPPAPTRVEGEYVPDDYVPLRRRMLRGLLPTAFAMPEKMAPPSTQVETVGMSPAAEGDAYQKAFERNPASFLRRPSPAPGSEVSAPEKRARPCERNWQKHRPKGHASWSNRLLVSTSVRGMASPCRC